MCKAAVDRMNGREVDGSRLVVQIAGDRRRERFNERRDSRGGERGGDRDDRRRGPQKEDVCYNC